MSEGQTPPEGQEPTPEELLQEMARRLAETPVRDILLQTMATFADLAGVRLGFGPGGAEHRDLAQARLAIESLRALIAVADAQLGAAQAKPFREPLAQLQLLFAREAEGGPEGAAPQEEAPAKSEDAASRLWTPPGSRR